MLRLAREHEVLITVEEGSIGGFAAQVLQTLAEHGVLDRGLKVRAMVLPDLFIDQDSPVAMYAKAGLDANAIVAKVFETLGTNVWVAEWRSTGCESMIGTNPRGTLAGSRFQGRRSEGARDRDEALDSSRASTRSA